MGQLLNITPGEQQATVRVKMARAVLTHECCSGHEPCGVGECVSRIKSLIEGGPMAGWANTLPVESIGTALSTFQDISVSVNRSSRKYWVHFYERHALKNYILGAVSQ